MKYSCNACGMYVDAGSGHDCYKPLPDNEPRVLKSVADEWQRRAECAEAELKKLWSIKIPTDTMEQEFQSYYRRGYQAAKSVLHSAVEAVYREGFEAGDTYRRTMECPTARPLDADTSWLRSKTYKSIND